jgi:hypothetical protein
LPQDAGALLFEGGERVGQGLTSYPNVYIRWDYSPKKSKPPDPPICVAHPL